MTKKKIIATVAIATGSVAISLGAFFGISGGVSSSKIKKFIEKEAPVVRCGCIGTEGECYEKCSATVLNRKHKTEVKLISKTEKTRVYFCTFSDFVGDFYTEHIIQIDEKASWLFFDEKDVVFSKVTSKGANLI